MMSGELKTRAHLLLIWPHSVAEVKFSLSYEYLSLTHSFSVIFKNIPVNHILPKTTIWVKNGTISFWQ